MVPADHDDGPRPHVLLLAHHPLDAGSPKGGEGLVGCSSKPSRSEVAVGDIVGGR